MGLSMSVPLPEKVSPPLFSIKDGGISRSFSVSDANCILILLAKTV